MAAAAAKAKAAAAAQLAYKVAQEARSAGASYQPAVAAAAAAIAPTGRTVAAAKGEADASSREVDTGDVPASSGDCCDPWPPAAESEGNVCVWAEVIPVLVGWVPVSCSDGGAGTAMEEGAGEATAMLQEGAAHAVGSEDGTDIMWQAVEAIPMSSAWMPVPYSADGTGTAVEEGPSAATVMFQDAAAPAGSNGDATGLAWQGVEAMPMAPAWFAVPYSTDGAGTAVEEGLSAATAVFQDAASPKVTKDDGTGLQLQPVEADIVSHAQPKLVEVNTFVHVVEEEDCETVSRLPRSLSDSELAVRRPSGSD